MNGIMESLLARKSVRAFEKREIPAAERETDMLPLK